MARFARPVKELPACLPGLALTVALLASGCGMPAVLEAWDPLPLAPEAPDRSWTPEEPATELRAPADAWQQTSGATLPAAQTTYDLPAIVDVALRNNPETRRAWEDSRAAAARYGRSLSTYYPEVGVEVTAGPSRFLFQDDPEPITVEQNELQPQIELTWTLLDFGRRASTAEASRQRLLAANFTFNRKMQDVVFAAQRAYFALDAARGMQRTAEKNLDLARSVREAAEERARLGLATQPDVLLTRQVDAKAVYDLENARVLVSDAQATLALALGIPANAPPEIADLDSQPLPRNLEVAVDDVIDAALQQRPDLAARMAQIRAGEAAVENAKSDFLPTIGFAGSYGADIWRYRINGAPRDDVASPDYAYMFNLDWDLFKGFDRTNAVREAEAERDAARAGLANLQLETTAAVWKAYFNYRAARKKLEYAESLLKASQDAYDANREGYGLGLATIVELLTGERDLANARYLIVQTRAELLTRSAELAWAAGAMQVGTLR
jgi:outer membrane protein TolC